MYILDPSGSRKRWYEPLQAGPLLVINGVMITLVNACKWPYEMGHGSMEIQSLPL